MRLNPEDPARELLSSAELDVLRHLSRGHSASSTARVMKKSGRTVRLQLEAICDRLDVDTPVEAVVSAVRRGWL